MLYLLFEILLMNKITMSNDSEAHENFKDATLSHTIQLKKSMFDFSFNGMCIFGCLKLYRNEFQTMANESMVLYHNPQSHSSQRIKSCIIYNIEHQWFKWYSKFFNLLR